MTSLLVLALITFAPATNQSDVRCMNPPRPPAQTAGADEQYLFVDDCGQPYEVGYHLEGTTLHFPRGGRHSLPGSTAEEAESIFRDTYGLVGDSDELVRTKW